MGTITYSRSEDSLLQTERLDYRMWLWDAYGSIQQTSASRWYPISCRAFYCPSQRPSERYHQIQERTGEDGEELFVSQKGTVWRVAMQQECRFNIKHEILMMNQLTSLC
jgi:hypothetical protein